MLHALKIAHWVSTLHTVEFIYERCRVGEMRHHHPKSCWWWWWWRWSIYFYNYTSNYYYLQLSMEFIFWCNSYLMVSCVYICFSVLQAIMYVLCFRMRSILDVPRLKSQLLSLPIDSILKHNLIPLKVRSRLGQYMITPFMFHIFQKSWHKGLGWWITYFIISMMFPFVRCPGFLLLYECSWLLN